MYPTTDHHHYEINQDNSKRTAFVLSKKLEFEMEGIVLDSAPSSSLDNIVVLLLLFDIIIV